jgi:glycosyltransferase involved in cell wall biosynthesis
LRWLVSQSTAPLEGLSEETDISRIRVITRQQHLACVLPLHFNVVVVNAPIYGIREQFSVPRAARGARLLHVLHFNIPLAYRGRLVVTIHDLILTTVSPYCDKQSSLCYAYPMLWLAARRAHHIITVSAYSKQQIVEHLHVEPSSISVMPNGVRACFRPHERSGARRYIARLLGFESRYLLFVGNFKPHKNIHTLLKSFAILRSQGKCLDRKLLVVSEDFNEDDKVRAKIRDLHLEGAVIATPFLSREALAQAYSGADALVMPSTSEGFGLPVAEAMACGTPVLCSRIPVLLEVAGDAAPYFDPSSAASLAATIDDLESNSEQQALLRRKGLARSKQFTISTFERRHVDLYQEFAELG